MKVFLFVKMLQLNEHFEKRNAVKNFSVNKQKYTVMYLTAIFKYIPV